MSSRLQSGNEHVCIYLQLPALLQEELKLRPNQLLSVINTAIESAIANDRDKLLSMLEALQKQYDGFKFAVTAPSDGTLTVTSVVIQTGPMRRRLLSFGDVVFVDGTEKTNEVQLK
jgi:hypothetical protein